MVVRLLCLPLLLTALATAVSAVTDVPLGGNRIRLTDSNHPQGRRNVVGLLDPAVPLPAVDPTVTGATASIGQVGGAVAVLDLPASGWTQTGIPPVVDFKFKSRTGPVRAARLRDGQSLRFTAVGPEAYALGGTPQGGVGVIVQVGDVRFCGLFGGQITRDDGQRFQARRAPAPAGCPALGTATTSTTGASTTTVATSTTTTETTTTTTTPPQDLLTCPCFNTTEFSGTAAELAALLDTALPEAGCYDLFTSTPPGEIAALLRNTTSVVLAAHITIASQVAECTDGTTSRVITDPQAVDCIDEIDEITALVRRCGPSTTTTTTLPQVPPCSPIADTGVGCRRFRDNPSCRACVQTGLVACQLARDLGGCFDAIGNVACATGIENDGCSGVCCPN